MEKKWRFIKLKEFAVINPKISLKNGKFYPTIYMRDVKPGFRWVEPNQIKKLKSSGSKFQNNDILFARITPCLENGKIAQVKNLITEHGFGSTEFFIFRAKDEISDSSFLYYLLLTRKIRKIAEKSMLGTSGRQRVQISALKNIEISVPDLNTQKTIGKLLTILDQKIELNKKMSEKLEEMTNLIFYSQFTVFKQFKEEDFIILKAGKMPKGWKIEKLGKHIEFVKGKKPKLTTTNPINNNYLPQILISTFEGESNGFADKDNSIILDIFDPIMVMDGASSGRIEIGYRGVVGSTLAKIQSISKEISVFFIYCFLKQKEDFINNNTTGTAIPHASKKLIYDFDVIIPPMNVMEKFSNDAENIIKKIVSNRKENNILLKLRDLLLPYLISGDLKIRNPNKFLELMEIET